MNYWIFKCNPNKYNIDGRLKDKKYKENSWRVTRYKDEIKAGDRAFIWRTYEEGRKFGIVALFDITRGPKEQTAFEHELKYYKEKYRKEYFKLFSRVIGIFTYVIPCLEKKELAEIEELKNLPIFHGFQQVTNMKVHIEDGKTLEKIILSLSEIEKF